MWVNHCLKGRPWWLTLLIWVIVLLANTHVESSKARSVLYGDYSSNGDMISDDDHGNVTRPVLRPTANQVFVHPWDLHSEPSGLFGYSFGTGSSPSSIVQDPHPDILHYAGIRFINTTIVPEMGCDKVVKATSLDAFFVGRGRPLGLEYSENITLGLAINQLNFRKATVKPKFCIDMIGLETQSLPKYCLGGMAQTIKDDGLMVFGPTSSLGAAASAALGDGSDIVSLSASALAPSLDRRTKSSNFYRSVPSASEYGIALGELLCYFGWHQAFVIDSPTFSIWQLVYDSFKKTSCSKHFSNFNIYRTLVDFTVFDYWTLSGDGASCAYCQQAFTSQVQSATEIFHLSNINVVISSVLGEGSNLVLSALASKGYLGPGKVFIQLEPYPGLIANCSSDMEMEGTLILKPAVFEKSSKFEEFQKVWVQSHTEATFLDGNAYIWDSVHYVFGVIDWLVGQGKEVNRKNFAQSFAKLKMEDGATGTFEFQPLFSSRPANMDLYSLKCPNGRKGEAVLEKVVSFVYFLPENSTDNNLVYEKKGVGTIKWSTGESTDLRHYDPKKRVEEGVPQSCNRDCSGNGYCLSNEICECKEKYTGPNCSTQKSFEYDDLVSIVFEVLNSIGILTCFIATVYLLQRMGHSYLVTVDSTFIVIPSLGIMVLFASGFCWTVKPTSTSCTLRFWFPLVGYTLSVSNFMARTLNLYKYYRRWLNAGLTENFQPKVKLSATHYFGFLALFGGLQYCLLIIMCVIAPLRAELIEQDPSTYMYECRTDPTSYYNAFMGVLLLINLVILVIVLAFAIRVSFVFKEINELKVFQFVYVSSFAILLTFGLLIYTLNSDQYAYNVTSLICLLFLGLVLLATFILPVVYKVFTLPSIFDKQNEIEIEQEPETSASTATHPREEHLEVFGQKGSRLNSLGLYVSSVRESNASSYTAAPMSPRTHLQRVSNGLPETRVTSFSSDRIASEHNTSSEKSFISKKDSL
eukprot:Nk52_evm13s621 gene=Nk52_evmTU13s621